MATSSLQTLSYLGANLMLGRQPVIASPLLDPETFPNFAGGGTPIVGGATLAQVGVAVRECPAYRTAYYYITNADTGATYSAVIDGHTVNYDADGAGATNLTDIVTGWAAAINANGSVNTIVQATPADFNGDGAVDAVKIVGLSSPDYSVDGSWTGSAAVTMVADAASAVIVMYGRTNASPDTSGTAAVVGAARAKLLGWHAVPRPLDGATTWAVAAPGYLTTLWPCNGVAALCPVATSVVGPQNDGGSVQLSVQAFVAPCVQESTS